MAPLKRYTPAILMVLSAACWGGGTILSKDALQFLDPVSLLAIQLLGSSATLWLLVGLTGACRTISRESFRNGLIGVLEPGIAYIFVLDGLAETSASVGTFITATEPLMVVALAAVIFKERTSFSTIIAATVALVGVVLLVSNDGEASSGSSFHGALLIVAGTLSAAFYVLLSKQSISHDSPILAASLQQSAAALFAVLIYLFRHSDSAHFNHISSGVILFAIFSGVVQYGVSFLSYLFAIRTMPIQRAVMYLNLCPLFGVGAAYLMLGERLGMFQWVGAALVMAGLMFRSVSLSGLRNKLRVVTHEFWHRAKYVVDDRSNVLP